MFSIVIHQNGFYIVPSEKTIQEEEAAVQLLQHIKCILERGLIYFIEIKDQYSVLTREEMWRWLRVEAKSLQVNYTQQIAQTEAAAIIHKLYEDIENLLLVRSLFPEEKDQEAIKNMAFLLKNITNRIYKEQVLEVVQVVPRDQRARIIHHFQKFFSEKSLKRISFH